MNRKWTLFTFGAGDYKGVEGYLNRQAAKGWELEKVYGFLARWKRTERPSRWCVDLLNAKADREEKLSYLDLCAEGGWELTALQGSMCIFRSKAGKEPFPVQTDPELEKKNYNKYYLKPAILSVALILVMIAMYAFLGLSVGTRFDNVAADLRYGWMECWVVLALYLAAPIWGLLAVWKVFHFMSSQIRNRGGRVTAPPPWAMWLNSVLSALSLFMGILVIVGIGLDRVLGGMIGSSSLYGVLPVMAISLFIQWLNVERELFKGEKRRHLIGAGVVVAALILLIVADVCAPYGDWSNSWFSSDKEKAVEIYEETFDRPIVHSEDVGLSEGDYVVVEHKITPMGEYWKMGYTYDEGEVGYLLRGQFSEVFLAPSRWQARLVAGAQADSMGIEMKYAPWPEEGLTPVDIDWADRAWYSRMTLEKGETVTFLVVQKGKLAARMVFPTELLTEENLSAIRAALER